MLRGDPAAGLRPSYTQPEIASCGQRTRLGSGTRPIAAQSLSLPTVILMDSAGKEVRRFGEPLPTADQFLDALKAVN